MLSREVSTITNIVLIYGLLVINWKVALGSLLIFGLAYWIILKFARSRLLINSKKIAQSYDYQVKGVRDVSDLDDKEFVRKRRLRNRTVSFM